MIIFFQKSSSEEVITVVSSDEECPRIPAQKPNTYRDATPKSSSSGPKFTPIQPKINVPYVTSSNSSIDYSRMEAVSNVLAKISPNITLTPVSYIKPSGIMQTNGAIATPQGRNNITSTVHVQGNGNITPTRSEKITMKIQKSHISPNEMVVVGSQRHVEEQLVLKDNSKPDYNSIKPGSGKLPVQNQNLTNVNNKQKQLGRVKQTLNVNNARNISNKQLQHNDNILKQQILQQQQKQQKHIQQQKPQQLQHQQKPQQLQHQQKQQQLQHQQKQQQLQHQQKQQQLQHQQKQQQLQQKQQQHQQQQQQQKQQQQINRSVVKNGNKPISVHDRLTFVNRPSPQNQRSGVNGIPNNNFNSDYKLNNSKNVNGLRMNVNVNGVRNSSRNTNNMNGFAPSNNTVCTNTNENNNSIKTRAKGIGRFNKKFKKKMKNRQNSKADVENVLTTLDRAAPYNTELGLIEKQQMSQNVLLPLLKTLSQLPMTNLSHALETIDTLTDALKLGKKVELSISQENENGKFF